MLTSIKQDGDLLTLEGYAQSNARVSAYMRTLETSGWMARPELGVIEAKSDTKADAQSAMAQAGRALPYQFSLKVRLSTPNTDTGSNGQPTPATQTKPVS
jgi:type IV pilus assembly protein PilN